MAAYISLLSPFIASGVLFTVLFKHRPESRSAQPEEEEHQQAVKGCCKLEALVAQPGVPSTRNPRFVCGHTDNTWPNDMVPFSSMGL